MKYKTDSGVETYDYDPWGNVVRVTKTEQDSNNNAIGIYSTDYQYDSLNRMTQMSYPSGRTVTMTRDSIGRLIELTTTDNEGNFHPVISDRQYRADGYWLSQTYGNGLTQTKSYDLQGRLNAHEAGDYSRHYLYDNNGNIIDVEDTVTAQCL